MLYAHAGLLLLAYWNTVTISKPFLEMLALPLGLVLLANVFNIVKRRRGANVICAGAGLFLGLLQVGGASFAFPHSGEGALGAAIIIAFAPWVYASATLLASVVLFFKLKPGSRARP